MRKLNPVDEVIKGALQALSSEGPPPVEEVPLEAAGGRYAAQSITSAFKLPPYPKSVVDGYAARADDLMPASPSAPVRLRLLEGVVRPGPRTRLRVGPGEAARIETGGYLPEGADVAVPVEDTVEEGGSVLVYRRFARWENVSLPGEEYEEGVPILREGWRIDPVRLAALHLEGLESVKVYRLEAAILNVGDEVVGESAGFRPYTQLLVARWLEEHGFTVASVEFGPDDPDAIAGWLRSRGEWLRVVLGGTSMGGHDYTVRAIESLSPSFLAHGVTIQPGKTACIAVKEGLVLGLSGLPVAALSDLELLLAPLLRGLRLEIPERRVVAARLARRITVKMGIRGFARVKLYRGGDGLVAEPLMVGGSGSMKSLLEADGYVVVPEESEGFDEGEVVEVRLLR